MAERQGSITDIFWGAATAASGDRSPIPVVRHALNCLQAFEAGLVTREELIAGILRTQDVEAVGNPGLVIEDDGGMAVGCKIHIANSGGELRAGKIRLDVLAKQPPKREEPVLGLVIRARRAGGVEQVEGKGGIVEAGAG